MSDNNAEAAIKAIEKKFVENANAKAPAKLVREFYAEDAILIPPGSPANVVGTKALTDFWHQMIFDDNAVDVPMATNPAMHRATWPMKSANLVIRRRINRAVGRERPGSMS